MADKPKKKLYKRPSIVSIEKHKEEDDWDM